MLRLDRILSSHRRNIMTALNSERRSWTRGIAKATGRTVPASRSSKVTATWFRWGKNTTPTSPPRLTPNPNNCKSGQIRLVHLSHVLFRVLALVGSLTLPLEESLTVLVQLRLGDHDFAGVDADGNALAYAPNKTSPQQLAHAIRHTFTLR